MKSQFQIGDLVKWLGVYVTEYGQPYGIICSNKPILVKWFKPIWNFYYGETIIDLILLEKIS